MTLTEILEAAAFGVLVLGAVLLVAWAIAPDDDEPPSRDEPW